MENNKTNIIVTFHIGRGGRFNNQGHCTYRGEDYKAKNSVEESNFLGFENESVIIEKFGDEVLDVITDLNYNTTSEAYKKFCNIYGDLGVLILKGASGDLIGYYVENGEPFDYDEDGQYDTTYGVKLEDCDEDQIELIVNSNEYKSTELIDWINKNTDFNLNIHGEMIDDSQYFLH